MNNLRAPVLLSFVCTMLLTTCGGGTKSGSGGPKQCAPTTSTCTAAQENAYATCVQNACATQYANCLGPNYKSGTFAGPCGSYMTCQNACPCNDTACSLACGLPSAECQACLPSIGTCSMTCTAPACYSGGTGTGGSAGTGAGGSTGTGTGGSTGTGANCAALLACCNATTDATLKNACNMYYAMVMAGGDTACSSALTVVRAQGACP